MSECILCIVCTKSIEISKKLLESINNQIGSYDLILHVASYKNLENYPLYKQLSLYFDNNNSQNKFFKKPDYVVFIHENTELYGNDFLIKLILPLKKDKNILFSIPSTMISPKNFSFYQVEFSYSQKQYGIPICNIITGLSLEKYKMFMLTNIVAIALRCETYLMLQDNYDFILNPIDFFILPEILKQHPQSIVISPECVAYLPSFYNFIDLWKMFYEYGKKSAWFNFKSKKFKIKPILSSPYILNLAYQIGYYKKYFLNKIFRRYK